ncbi:MAG: hypothetical protein AAF735_00315 [Myxococcota bacterium]
MDRAALAEMDRDSADALWNDVAPGVRGAETLAEATQLLVDKVVERYADDMVLARCFLTRPLRSLPAELAATARGNANDETLPPECPCLNLVGTAGVEAAWNERQRSQGHQTIPLPSKRFVQAIPMIARLLTQLSGNEHLFDSDGSSDDFSLSYLAGLGGVFFVSDARSSKDVKRRLIIPAQDFVARYQVRSVFGVGSRYLDGSVLVFIAFTCAQLSSDVASRFVPIISEFKSSTDKRVRDNRVFD